MNYQRKIHYLVGMVIAVTCPLGINKLNEPIPICSYRRIVFVRTYKQKIYTNYYL